MSRIGKQPVVVPEGVTVSLPKGEIIIKGPKGELKLVLHTKISVEYKDDKIIITPVVSDKLAKMLHGTFRSLINNMVIGVVSGYEKTLLLSGVGYRVNMVGKQLSMNIGFKHTVEVDIPDDLQVSVKDDTEIIIGGIDKQKVGLFASQVRDLRPPEPYKGHGIRYSDEHVRRKEKKAIA